MELLPWREFNPDLKIMGNIWSQLVRDFSNSSHQFSNMKELKNAIGRLYKQIETEYIQLLFQSLHRLFGISHFQICAIYIFFYLQSI